MLHIRNLPSGHGNEYAPYSPTEKKTANFPTTTFVELIEPRLRQLYLKSVELFPETIWTEITRYTVETYRTQS